MMNRFFFSFVVVLMAGLFSGGVFAGEAGAEEIMIKGTTVKVDCDKGTMALSEVRDLRSKKERPDVTLKLTKETKLRGVAECKEIQKGSPFIAAYVESDEGNVATELILTRREVKLERNKELKKEDAERILKEQEIRMEKLKNNAKEVLDLRKEQNGSDK
jgi:hypothetical protein